MENKRVILLLSGGIDSTTLLAKLIKEKYEVIALSFSYGQKHSVELDYAKNNAKKYGVVFHEIIELDAQLFEKSALVSPNKMLSNYQEESLPTGQVNAYVPFRNLLFTSMAFSYAETLGIEEVYLAINKDDGINFWDCTSSFIHNINQVSKQASNIRLVTPFIHLTKAEIISLSRQLNVNLEDTITCYQPIGSLECGTCLSCLVKQASMVSTK